jgi:hypothetical protein
MRWCAVWCWLQRLLLIWPTDLKSRDFWRTSDRNESSKSQFRAWDESSVFACKELISRALSESLVCDRRYSLLLYSCEMLVLLVRPVHVVYELIYFGLLHNGSNCWNQMHSMFSWSPDDISEISRSKKTHCILFFALLSQTIVIVSFSIRNDNYHWINLNLQK